MSYQHDEVGELALSREPFCFSSNVSGVVDGADGSFVRG
jgi:hypothetical protein